MLNFDCSFALRPALVIQGLLALALSGACARSADCFEPTYSNTIVDESAAIRVEVNSAEFVVSNISEYPIYHEVFPSDFLSMIEWGPCEDAAKCPELRIDPGGQAPHSLETLAFDDSKTVWVFWWHLSDPEAGLVFETLDMKSLQADLPPRIPCGMSAD